MTDPHVWVAVTAADALAPGEAVGVDARGTEVAIFNVDGELCALSRRCPHKGGDLSEGMVRDGAVTCPLHWWRFEVRTGRRVEVPEQCLDRYPLRVEAGRIEVLVPPARPPMAWRDRLLAAGREWSHAQQEKPSCRS